MHMKQGEQLEIIDRQKTKAQDAKDLVMYFQEFTNNNTARLDLVKNTHGWEGKAKVNGIIMFNGIMNSCRPPPSSKGLQSLRKRLMFHKLKR